MLKSGLVLIGTDIGFKVRNFNHANMASLQKQWDDVTEALAVAAGLLADFGLSDATLTADSVLVPIAYYVHRRSSPSRIGPRLELRRIAESPWLGDAEPCQARGLGFRPRHLLPRLPRRH